MPYYGSDAKEEIRSRVDIVDVIGECVNLKRNGSNYTGLCPFHNEKTPSFSVAPSKGLFHCFGCHESGDVFTFVQKYYNYTFSEAMEYLAERAGVKLESTAPTESQRVIREKKEKLIEINTEAARFFHNCMTSDANGEAAYEYFTGRGLSKNTIIRFGLGYSPAGGTALYQHLKEKEYEDSLIIDSGLVVHYEKTGVRDKFIGRAMFPIFDMRGKVIGFGGRIMGKGEPKYLNSPDTEIFIKRNNLYAYNIARNSRSKRVILCEGYMDVISLHQAGFDYAIASLGTALTDGHVALIKRLGAANIYVCYDSDRAGTAASVKAIGLLGDAGMRTRVIHMDPAKDPDEYIKTFGADKFEEQIQKAENSFLFLMGVKAQDYDMNDPTEKTAFYQYLAQEIYKAGGDVGWKTYTEAVCKKFGIDVNAMQKTVAQNVSSHPVISNTKDEELDDYTGTSENAERIRPPSRNAIHEKRRQNDMLAQKKLLSWLAEEPGLYAYIKGVVAPTDLVGELYVELAKKLFTQLDEGSVSVPVIIEAVEDENRDEAVACFSTVLEDTYKVNKGKTLTEIVIKIKELHIKEKAESINKEDMAAQQELMNERIELQKFKQKGIRI